MDAEILAGLPVISRLALAYAPAHTRGRWLAVLALDARLAGVVRQAAEPVLAQIRLAWWRERLAELADKPEQRDPLLRLLAGSGIDAAALSALVDGWEQLLGEGPLGHEALTGFADGRGAAMAALARACGEAPEAALRAGRQWALADLSLHLSDSTERAAAGALLASGAGEGALPGKAMRPLAILAALTRRAARRGTGEALSGVGSLALAMRIGFLGR